jgi:ElaB/YqjD/DUF883 family membrane-anchored ribosome-binding protein
METTMADLKSISDQATTDLAEDLTALRDDISRLSASVLELVQQQAATTKSQVFDAVDGARQRFADQSAEAKDRLGALTNDLESTIERNPFTAIFAGALAGFLIGILVRPTR